MRARAPRFLALLTCAWAVCGLAPATTVTLYPTDDAYVRGGSYGAERYGVLADPASLVVKYNGEDNDYTRETFFKFDLSDTTGTVDSAVLYLTIRNRNTQGVGQQYLKEVLDDAWSEGRVTYENRPTDRAASVLHSWVSPDIGEVVALDLTAAVNARTDNLLSLVIYSDDERVVNYYSKDRNAQVWWPRLVIAGEHANAPGPKGRVLMEYWEGLTTPTVAGLLAEVNYPKRPAGRDYPSALETVANFRNDWGVRMRGYFHTPVSGDYTFSVSGATVAQVFLSADDSPDNLSSLPIAEVTTATAYHEWDAYASQTSGPIALERGAKYYFEVLHAAGVGEDHLSVAWRLPRRHVRGPGAGRSGVALPAR